MRQVKWILSRRETYIAVIGVILIFLGYYTLREYFAAGYLKRTIQVDYRRFTTSTMAWHHHPWYYYLQNWYTLEFFVPYMCWLPVAIMIGMWSKMRRAPVILLTAQAIVIVGILSYPVVKLMWYDAPVYPLLALLCAIGFVAVWGYFERKAKISTAMSSGLFAAVLLILFAIPVKSMYQRNADLYLPVDVMEREGFFLRELRRTKPEFTQFKVLMLAQQNAHYTQVDFYVNAYNRYAGCDIAVMRDTLDVQAGDTIAVCQEEQIKWLHKHFEVEELAESEIGCVLVSVVKD
jgi:hypothetical protein